MPASYINNAKKQWLLAKVRELDSEGYTQAEIGSHLKISQQTVSYALSKLREMDRLALENHHRLLASTYRQTLDNLIRIRRELWNDLKQTQDRRTRASYYHELQEVNLKIMELASTNDVVLATIRNAERIAQEAKQDLEKAKRDRKKTQGSPDSTSTLNSEASEEKDIVLTTTATTASAQDAEQELEEIEDYESIPLDNDNSVYGIVDDSQEIADADILINKYKAHGTSASTANVIEEKEEDKIEEDKAEDNDASERSDASDDNTNNTEQDAECTIVNSTHHACMGIGV